MGANVENRTDYFEGFWSGKLFLTERDEADRVECSNLRAADIKENVESGRDVDVKSLGARVTARERK